MSKTTLKKALAGFGEPELRQLILDIYSKSKDARELLDFYAEPDIESKTEEYERLIDKEAGRMKRRVHRPRMSVILGYIRRFSSLEPGDEYVARLMVHTSGRLMEIGADDFLPQTTNGQAVRFIAETISYLSSRRMLDGYLPGLGRMAEKMRPKIGSYGNPLRAAVTEMIENAM